jgi:hypothetical protein
MFAFTLCLALGVPHPRYLSAYLTAADMAEWQAFNNLSPIGQVRDDYHAALVAWTTARTQGNKSAKLASFMPRWGKRQGKTEAEIMAGFAASAAAHKAKQKG